MEKYLITDESTDFGKKILETHMERQRVFEQAREYLSQYGIGTDFALCGGTIYLPAESSDAERFNKQLRVPDKEGYRAFRANSEVARNWKTYLPAMSYFIFDVLDIYKQRMYEQKFVYQDKVYMYVDVPGYDFETPPGMWEITANEYETAKKERNRERREKNEY